MSDKQPKKIPSLRSSLSSSVIWPDENEISEVQPVSFLKNKFCNITDDFMCYRPLIDREVRVEDQRL